MTPEKYPKRRNMSNMCKIQRNVSVKIISQMKCDEGQRSVTDERISVF